MLRRCYGSNLGNAYMNVIVCEEWHNFQNFAEWFEENYYEVNDETMCLDKDILCKGNNIYSPDTCIFVPQRINNLFIKQKSSRNGLPIGVWKYGKKFVSQLNCVNKKRIYLGYFNTIEQAFEVYKNFKEKYIKEVADEYKDLIPSKLYEAMYEYEVEITD